MNEYIDASIFLGMHSPNEGIRIACKNFFVRRLRKTITMSLEQVGKCDDIIWSRFSNEEQAKYYPFMDRLHTLMNIQRIPYSEHDIQVALGNSGSADQSILDKLTIGMVVAKEGILYTVNPDLVKDGLPVQLLGDDEEELSFPAELEKYYQQSLEVRI